MQNYGFVESFNAAIEGFIYVLKTQRNMRIHFMVAVAIALCGIYLNFSKTELMLLCLTVTFVLMSEMANTTVELLVDLVKTEFHPLAKIIKDISAGCVLVASINAVIVGYMLFESHIPFSLEEGLFRIRQSTWHVTFMTFVVVLSLVLFGKVFFHKGKPLRGGMPSGHAAMAFSIWTIVTFLTTNTIVIILTFLMAFLIARHRIKDSIHTVWEVIIGGFLGVLVTTLMFQIFK